MFSFILLFSYGCNSADKDTEIQDVGNLDSGISQERDADGDGLSIEDGDCDDEDASIPGQEFCDGVDNDCDGDIDEPDSFDASLWYKDQDNDGFGTATETQIACVAPEGFVDNNEDCNDEDASIFPEAFEVWYDGIDQNCDGESDFDQDADGQESSDFGGSDCDDEEESIFLGASEIWYDGIDQNCDGENDFDQDADGQESSDFGGSDCDDDDASINTSATEIWYDGVDSNCDGESDYDQDGDGQENSDYGGSDCDDLNEDVYFGAPDTWYDGIDANCDGESDYDQDGDGEDSLEYGGSDCDDGDASINTSATEIWYDGIDQNCSGGSDFDQDEDGFDDRMVDITNTPQFVMELHPIGNKAYNALQGLAVDIEQDELWMSVDTSVLYENVLINRLSLQSGNPQYCAEYKESNNIGLGHGQDLSIEYTSSGERLLWIGSESDRGVTRIHPDSMTVEVLSNLLPSGWSHSTPTMGLSNQWVAVRGSKDGDEANNDWIRIYDKTDIEAGFSSGVAPVPLYEFNIALQQRVEPMWFQGLALDEEAGFVYAITGNNSLSQPDKLLYVYDLDGNVISDTNISMDWSAANAIGSKYEPEGLSLVQDPNGHTRYLYFTMMFGGTGNNIKRLYSIAPSSINTGGSYSNSDIDWLIRYNTSSGEVSISTALSDGTLGCETKRTIWSNGWSSFVGYYADGDPHLLLQKESQGTMKIHPLDWDAELNSATKSATWSSGWSSFHAWEHAGESYLFYYKEGSTYSGIMKTQKLTSSGNTGTIYENEYWSSGWKTHIYTLPNGDDYLLRYMPSNQNLRLAPLTSGYIGSDVYNDTWGSGYVLFHSVQKGAYAYLVALNELGELESYAVQGNGLLTLSDSITTSLSDWTNLVGYTLEGRAIVHLYREIDGFYTRYEIDDAGFWEGPIETGFEEMGWSSIQHFQTTP